MVEFIKFHYYNCFIYIILRTISYTLRSIIRTKKKQYFQNPFITLLLMFMGEILSIFLYIIENKISKKIFKNEEIENYKLFQIKGYEEIEKENMKKKLKKIKVLSIIIFCGIIDCLTSFNYSYYYSYELEKINNQLDNLNRIFLMFFIFILEIYFYNIQTYNYHYLGIIFCVFSLLLIIIPNLIKISNIQINILVLFIIYIENGYLRSIQFLFEKQLNFYYYVNSYFICFVEGLFLFIMCSLFSFFFIKKLSMINIIINMYKNDSFYFIIIIIIDSICTCFYNISRLKISEKNRPSYNSVGDLICIFCFNIYLSFFEKENKNKIIWTLYTILFTFFSLLGSFIYCEIITINICNLDENTFDNTSKRASLEIISINNLTNDDCIDD